ncbi:MAG TPA: RDD family protein [Chitinophagaceae bacterium]|nr:RDD family protein [Chitinophagaceae bacterium]
MSVIKIPTSFNIDVEFEVPEFYRRLLSLLIDMVLEFLYLLLAIWIMNRVVRNSDLQSDDTPYNLEAVWLMLLLPILLYHIILELTMNGQSIGKKLMGIKVVHENGGRASIGQFLIRWLLRVSDVWIVVLILILASGVGFWNDAEATFIILAALAFLITDIVLVVSSKKGQRIGDVLAHTILIRTNTRANIEETVFQEVADTYTPVFPQIMQLSDKDINAIKSILETAKRKGDFNMAATASEKIKAHLKIDSSMSPFDFLEVLLKDYNYLSVK